MANELARIPSKSLKTLVDAAVTRRDHDDPYPAPDPVFHPDARGMAVIKREELAVLATKEDVQDFLKALANYYPYVPPEAVVGLLAGVWETVGGKLPRCVLNADVRARLACGEEIADMPANPRNLDIVPSGGRIIRALRAEHNRTRKEYTALVDMSNADRRGPLVPLITVPPDPYRLVLPEMPVRERIVLPPDLAAQRDRMTYCEEQAWRSVIHMIPKQDRKSRRLAVIAPKALAELRKQAGMKPRQQEE